MTVSSSMSRCSSSVKRLTLLCSSARSFSDLSRTAKDVTGTLWKSSYSLRVNCSFDKASSRTSLRACPVRNCSAMVEIFFPTLYGWQWRTSNTTPRAKCCTPELSLCPCRTTANLSTRSRSRCSASSQISIERRVREMEHSSSKLARLRFASSSTASGVSPSPPRWRLASCVRTRSATIVGCLSSSCTTTERSFVLAIRSTWVMS
mmetsp:Transcript_7102/g.18511  ORF Transcript_7102/g.18511 Transcript_7102/m.18511 type:complete len:205 (-) Transcript_7102:983-1597(-)